MTFKELWTQKGFDRPGLAAKVGATQMYLSQLAHGHKKPSPQMAKTIAKATDNRVKPEDLLPEFFRDLH